MRNHWKRLLREAFRLRREELPAGLDLVVIPRVKQPPPLLVLQASLVRVSARAAKKLAEPPGEPVCHGYGSVFHPNGDPAGEAVSALY